MGCSSCNQIRNNRAFSASGVSCLGDERLASPFNNANSGANVSLSMPNSVRTQLIDPANFCVSFNVLMLTLSWIDYG